MAKYNCERYGYATRRWTKDYLQDRRRCQANSQECRGIGVAEARENGRQRCPKEVCVLGGAGIVCSLNVREKEDVKVERQRGAHGEVCVHKNRSTNTYPKTRRR